MKKWISDYVEPYEGRRRQHGIHDGNCFLYLLTNRVNGKKYVGVATDPRIRFGHHKSAARRGYGGCKVLYAAIRKHGWENFDCRVVAIGKRSYIGEMEVKAIAVWGTTAASGGGYNVSSGGDGLSGWRDDPASVAKWRKNHTEAVRKAFKRPEVVAKASERALLSAETMRKRGSHRNARKTHCPKGHEYAGDNLYVGKDGHRGCRACAAEQMLKRNRRLKGLPEDTPLMGNATKTHCIRGHELTPENVYHPPKHPGRRACRVCQKMFGNRSRSKPLVLVQKVLW